jgi:hypothetical protein
MNTWGVNSRLYQALVKRNGYEWGAEPDAQIQPIVWCNGTGVLIKVEDSLKAALTM